MEILAMIAVIGIVAIIIYFINKSLSECGEGFTNPIDEIENIRGYYNLLKKESNQESKKLLKKNIKDSITKIEISFTDNYDKYKLTNIYSNELAPLLDREFTRETHDKFALVLNNIKFLINYAANPKRYDYVEIINNIKKNFDKLNELYSSAFISKTITFNLVQTEVEILTKKIYDSLLKITTYDDLNNSGILLILNTTLKRAYELNDILSINSLKDSFNQKIKTLNFQNSQETTIDNNNNNIKPLEIDLPAAIVEPTTSISLNKDKAVINKIQEDFNKIYNSFDTINAIYKNNGNITQIDELKRVISESIDNLISYNKNDISYKANITNIKNVIISAILDKELSESYLTKDDKEIIRVKNKFYDAIIEIKNIIINSYSKSRSDDNREVCLKDIIEAIMRNEYPIELKKLQGCKKLSFLTDDNVIINPKIAISSDKGKSWAPAGDYMKFKETGVSDDPYLFTYKIATSSNGKNWSFL